MHLQEVLGTLLKSFEASWESTSAFKETFYLILVGAASISCASLRSHCFARQDFTLVGAAFLRKKTSPHSQFFDDMRSVCVYQSPSTTPFFRNIRSPYKSFAIVNHTILYVNTSPLRSSQGHSLAHTVTAVNHPEWYVAELLVSKGMEFHSLCTRHAFSVYVFFSYTIARSSTEW